MIATEAEARSFVANLCDGGAMDRLDRFVALLLSEMERQNLIAAGTVPVLWQRHMADSAQLLNLVSRETGTWLDLGTGAGFPGVVIAAMRPEIPMVLVESRRRRIEWLEHCCDVLDLSNCHVAGMPLEQLDSFPVGVISARAFAPLPKLLDLSARFSTGDTVWLLPKGRNAGLELQALPQNQREMFHVEQSLTDPDAGILVRQPLPLGETA